MWISIHGWWVSVSDIVSNHDIIGNLMECNVTSLASKACSGKCMGSCSSVSRVWVAAACGGVIALFEKKESGDLALLPQEGGAGSGAVDSVIAALLRGAEGNRFDQLVIIGSDNDIAWVEMSLPPEVAKLLVAEIQYPLVKEWLKPGQDFSYLTRALEQLFLA